MYKKFCEWLDSANDVKSLARNAVSRVSKIEELINGTDQTELPDHIDAAISALQNIKNSLTPAPSVNPEITGQTMNTVRSTPPFSM